MAERDAAQGETRYEQGEEDAATRHRQLRPTFSEENVLHDDEIDDAPVHFDGMAPEELHDQGVRVGFHIPGTSERAG